MASFPNAGGVPPTTTQHALNNLADHLAHVSSLAYDPSHDAEHERHVKDYLVNHVPHSNVRATPVLMRDDTRDPHY